MKDVDGRDKPGHDGKVMKLEAGRQIVSRHPEVRAKRASKDAARAPWPSPFEARTALKPSTCRVGIMRAGAMPRPPERGLCGSAGGSLPASRYASLGAFTTQASSLD